MEMYVMVKKDLVQHGQKGWDLPIKNTLTPLNALRPGDAYMRQ